MFGGKKFRKATNLDFQIFLGKMDEGNDTRDSQKKRRQCDDLSLFLGGWKVRFLQIVKRFRSKKNGLLGQFIFEGFGGQFAWNMGTRPHIHAG